MPSTIPGHKKFVINDVEFEVPPTEIHINTEAANYTWQTLRTKNAQKVKSGHGVIDISFTAVFVGLDDIIEKLIPIVLQLKLTPICYVENKYIRDNILPDDLPGAGKNIALIMKSMALTVRPELLDTVTVHFNFAWFNYSPYTQDFNFKSDLFTGGPVKTPAESHAWAEFWRPELNKITIPSKLKSDLQFVYSDFSVGPEFVGPIQEPASHGFKLEEEMADRDMADPTATPSVTRVNRSQDVNNISERTRLSEWVPTTRKYPSGKGDLLLWKRGNYVNTNASDLTVTGITLEFQNIVAMLPIIGHQYATYQHMGSIDPVVHISIIATSDDAKKRITRMWNAVEQNALTFRHIEQQYLQISIQNSMLAMFLPGNPGVRGARTFITDSLLDSTIPGQPGSWSLNLRLRATDNNLQEDIIQEFVSSDRVRAEIMNVIVRNLKRTNHPFKAFSMTHVKIDPTTEKTPRNAAFYNVVNKLAEATQDFINATSSRLSQAFFSTSFSLDTSRHGFRLSQDRIDALIATFQLIRGINPKLGNMINKGIAWRMGDKDFNLTHNQNLVGGENFNSLRDVFNEFEQESQTKATLSLPEYLDTTDDQLKIKKLLRHYLEFIREHLDNVMRGPDLELEQFADVKELADQIGTFRGKATYTDFPQLKEIAHANKLKSFDLNPDFYFYSGPLDGRGFIDPGLVETARKYALSLYTTDTNNPDDKDKRGFFAKMSDFVQDTYINQLSGEMRDQFVDNWNVKADAETTKHGAIFIDDRGPNISGFSFLGGDKTYTNANAGGLLNEFLLPRESKDGPLKYANSNDPPKAKPTKGFRLTPSATKTGAVVTSAEELNHDPSDTGIFDENSLASLSADVVLSGSFTPPLKPLPRPNKGQQVGQRNARNPKASKFHKGVDYSAIIGTPVYTAAAGKITHVGFQNKDDHSVGFGLRIRVHHKDIEGLYTVYAHLSEIGTNPDGKPWAVGNHVPKNSVLGRTGVSGTATYRDSKTGEVRTAPHLHFEIREGAGTDSGVRNPEAVFRSQQPRIEGNSTGFRFGRSLFARSIESFEDSLNSGQALKMVRAYPTFKLYFIEEDTVDGRRFGFDDFFSYNSVKSIRMIRDRDVPADLCIIELTNISGILSNRRFRDEVNNEGKATGTLARKNNDGELSKENVFDPLAVDTLAENPIASMMLQEGTRIELRLGYDNNPENLEVVFVGQTTEVEFNETDDLITIVCQSYSTELAQQLKGIEPITKENGWFWGPREATTRNVLSSMMQQPELIHFGRWTKSVGQTNSNRKLLNNRFEWKPRPQDDNIFAPPSEHLSYQGVIRRKIYNKIFPTIVDHYALSYHIYKTTIWDIFKEMELRHPECITSPVPYQDQEQGWRMTMFFGIPNQLYFARDPNIKEDRFLKSLQDTIKNADEEALKPLIEQAKDQHGKFAPSLIKTIINAGLTADAATQALFLGRHKNFYKRALELGRDIEAIVTKNKRIKEHIIKNIQFNSALKNRSIKPFRNYHLVTSDHHIIRNDIRASSIGIYNTVSVGYFSGGGSSDDAIKRLQGTEPPKDVFRLKVDAALPDEEIQEAFIQYPSCEGKTLGKLYALGALKRFMREVYKGELVIMGNPAIKPYDIVYVFDEYTDMVGPIEVRRVVHTLSQETGFVTAITPDLCTTVNEWSTLSTLDAMGLVAEGVMKDVFKIGRTGPSAPREVSDSKRLSLGVSAQKADSLGTAARALVPVVGAAAAVSILAGPLAPLVVAPNALIGGFIAAKLVNYSQFRHPITFSPLIYKGRPMMAGVASKQINNTWVHRLDKWWKDGVKGFPLVIEDWFENMTPLRSAADWVDHTFGTGAE